MPGEFDRLMTEAPAYGYRVGLGRTQQEAHGPVDRLILHKPGARSRAWVYDTTLDAVAARALDWIYDHEQRAV